MNKYVGYKGDKIMNITLKSYDGKLVRVPEDKKEEYLRNQERIKMYLDEGKSLEEIKEILKFEK